MRMRTSLFELLLLLIPAIAVTLGLVMGALSGRPEMHGWLLTAAQSVLMVATLTAICCWFHSRAGAQAFAGAFLGAALGHLLLVYLASQSGYGSTFPTVTAFIHLWNAAHPDQAINPGMSVNTQIWSSFPSMGSGMTGGYSGFNTPLSMPVVTGYAYAQRPIFVDIGVWTTSLLLGVICGMIAKAMRTSEKAD